MNAFQKKFRRDILKPKKPLHHISLEIGVSKGMVGKWFNQNRLPTLPNLIKFLKFVYGDKWLIALVRYAILMDNSK